MLKGTALVKYQSNRSGEFYFIIDIDGELTCNCKGWIFRKHCKHLDHYKITLATITTELQPKRILNAPAEFYLESAKINLPEENRRNAMEILAVL